MKSHVYITGSINEPGGNHQNEGAIVGLPLMYLKSGCMSEYCKGFGISINKKHFKENLKSMMKSYDKFRMKLKKYPYDSINTCTEYYNLFKRLKKIKELFFKSKNQ